MKNPTRIALLICPLMLANCAKDTGSSDSARDIASVTGTITFVRGWGATDFPRPDTSYFDPRPLMDVKIALLEYISPAESPGDPVTDVYTDSLGHYELVALPGTYYLAVHAAHYGGVLVASAWFDRAELVSHLEMVKLASGQVLGRDIEVHELVPQ